MILLASGVPIQETTRPAAANFLKQQAKFDDFMDVFNHQRPLQSLVLSPPVLAIPVI
jgi:hypothetical protein